MSEMVEEFETWKPYLSESLIEIEKILQKFHRNAGITGASRKQRETFLQKELPKLIRESVGMK